MAPGISIGTPLAVSPIASSRSAHGASDGAGAVITAGLEVGAAVGLAVVGGAGAAMSALGSAGFAAPSRSSRYQSPRPAPAPRARARAVLPSDIRDPFSGASRARVRVT